MTESHSTYGARRLASFPEAEHHFFAWLVGSIVVLVFVGFARTYYLHSLFGMHIMILGFWASLVTAVVLFDSIRKRRVQPAFGFGATIIVVFLYLVYFGSRTPLWQHFAANAVG